MKVPIRKIDILQNFQYTKFTIYKICDLLAYNLQNSQNLQ